MSCILQISDTHFGTEQPPVVQALTQLARGQSPAAVVLSGDVTQRATRPQFAAAKAFMAGLGLPTLVIPGNHDIPLFQLGARLFTPYGRYREALGADLEPVFDAPDWLVIGVNTTRWYRHKNGEIAGAQIARVAARLAQASRRQTRLVVIHQPVVAIEEEDVANLVRGRAEAVLRWSQAGADLILGGHIHLPYVRPLHQRVVVCPRAIWAVQAGTALSRRVRGDVPNSVNLIRHRTDAAGRRAEVERWDYCDAPGRFECFDIQPLALGDVAPSIDSAPGAEAIAPKVGDGD